MHAVFVGGFLFAIPKLDFFAGVFIEGVFAPKVATDIPNDGMINDESRMARKLLIRDKIYIDVNGRRYDATGKLVNDK